jgi:hypothetical protein
MLFLVPILIGGASLLAAGVGVVAGIEGASNMSRAKEIGEEAQHAYGNAIQGLDATRNNVKHTFDKLNEEKVAVIATTFKDLMQLFHTIRKKIRRDEFFRFATPEIVCEMDSFSGYEMTVFEAEKALSTGVNAYLAGCAASSATSALASSIGVASTGTALSGLSGAAAHSAFMAWLGGGSLAIGGGGMALGTIVFGGVIAAPALLIGGFALACEGEKALTEANRYSAEVQTALEQIETFKGMLGGITYRVTELKSIMQSLNVRLRGLITSIKPDLMNVRNERDASMLHTCILFANALREIIEVPLIEDDGKMTEKSLALISRYSN